MAHQKKSKLGIGIIICAVLSLLAIILLWRQTGRISPYDRTRTLTAEDVRQAEGLIPPENKAFKPSEAELQEILSALNDAQPGCFYDGKPLKANLVLKLYCGEDGTEEYILSYAGGILQMDCDPDTARHYDLPDQGERWQLEDPQVKAAMDALLKKYA